MSGHPEADIYHRQSFGHASGMGQAPALLIVGALVANLVFSNPGAAKHGVKSFLGLPSYALVAVTFLIGTASVRRL